MATFPNSFRSRRLRIISTILVLIVVGIYMGISLIGYNVVFIPAPHHLTGTPSGDYQEVNFPSRGQPYQVYGFYLPGGPVTPVLIVAPGYRDDRRSDGSLSLANALRELGYTVLFIDLNANGGDTTGTGRISMGYHERYDVLGAFDYLVASSLSERVRLGRI